MVYNENIFLNNHSLSIFKNKNQIHLYVYNKNYFCLIKITTNIQIKLKNQNSINLNYDKPHITLLTQKIEVFLKQFHFCNFTKIKFTGKGYKIKKNSAKSIILLFNRAHITTIWWRNNIIKKLKKYKIYIKYTNTNKNIINTILNIRLINIFTKKGLRKSRQVLLKKKGKK